MAENLIASIENDWRDMEKDLGKFQVSETNNNLLSSSDQLQERENVKKIALVTLSYEYK